MARRGSGGACEQSTYLVCDPDYGSGLLQKLNSMRTNYSLTDTVLCVDHEEFSCHKSVLAASSAYFQAMFTSGLKESCQARISFSEVSSWILKGIIDYAYSGHLEINNENAQEMMAASNQFAYPRIAEACSEFLQQQLHSSNCLEIEKFAIHHNCLKLQKCANVYVLENFSTVIDHDEFLELDVEHLKKYISSDLIDVRAEEIVFDAVMRWVKYDVDERCSFLPELLDKVRLGVLEMHSLNIIEQEPLVVASPECLSLVTQAQDLKTVIEGQAGKRRCSLQDCSQVFFFLAYIYIYIYMQYEC